MGIGGAPDGTGRDAVSLPNARKRAKEHRAILHQGKDPLKERQTAKAEAAAPVVIAAPAVIAAAAPVPAGNSMRRSARSPTATSKRTRRLGKTRSTSRNGSVTCKWYANRCGR